MATSLAQQLATLADTARTTADSPAARADAGAALGHLGRALARLRVDGVSPAVGDRREQHVAALADACTEVGARAPATESRLTQLAAAAADTVGILRGRGTVGSRWAAATAVADAATPLADLIAAGLQAGPAAQWLTEVRRQAALVQQTAALEPPMRADAALLDHPLPIGFGVGSADPAIVVGDATAALVHAMATTAAVPSIAEALAYTVAAETLSNAAHGLDQEPRGKPGADQVTAAHAWRAVRATLGPFDDGSRRLQPHAPRAVQAAGRLHAALRRARPDPAAWSAPLRAAVAAATQHLPTLAAQLDHTVRSWAGTGALLAYAVDLPPREDRVAEQLRGHRPGGLIRADALDLRPVTDAVHNARLLSAAVAARAADPGMRAAADFPRRTWGAHRTLLNHPSTTAALSAAKHQTYLQLQAARRRPHGPGRPR